MMPLPGLYQGFTAAFTGHDARQCGAYTEDLTATKLKAPLFHGLRGRGQGFTLTDISRCNPPPPQAVEQRVFTGAYPMVLSFPDRPALAGTISRDLKCAET